MLLKNIVLAALLSMGLCSETFSAEAITPIRLNGYVGAALLGIGGGKMIYDNYNCQKDNKPKGVFTRIKNAPLWIWNNKVALITFITAGPCHIDERSDLVDVL